MRWLKQQVWDQSKAISRGLGLAALVIVGMVWARAALPSLASAGGLPAEEGAVEPTSLPAPEALVGIEVLPPFVVKDSQGPAIRRRAMLETYIPDRPRMLIARYTVQRGDTLFGIAENFGLKPETLLWGNFDVLEDNPHSLKPGQDLNILPVDGTFYVWKQGDGLIGVADFFGVSPQDILDWPGNQLPQDLDLTNPDIVPGTSIVIPGGQRETVDWRAPRITRANPASARILGPGFCGSIYDGPVGAGTFVWPTPGRSISGYSFSLNIHPAIDIGGSAGNAIYATDAGVVVYAGWHNGGYGNVVVIDHGNGWQSLYAHMNTLSVGCGDGLFQGSIIGGMGSTGNSTGNHLHFEIQNDQFGKVNPLNFLP
jgi:murein DD-endopeptidase MepM/ murein hydrolase activator NlpD